MKRKGVQGLTGQLKEQLIKQALERRSRKFEQEQSTPGEGLLSNRNNTRSIGSSVPDRFCRFDQHPGYKQIQIIREGAIKLGIDSPYFRVHDGVAGPSTHIDGEIYVNFSSYNYLGLNGHPEVNDAARQAIEQCGTSVSASRVVSGERAVHGELENALAEVYEVDDCVTFVSGHATNVTSIGYLFGAKDLIIHDALIHNSILMGIQLSGARRRSFAHNDLERLEAILRDERKSFERALIVVEGIYSMDGDYPDLPALVELKNRYKAFLMVDEAHSFGVMGKRGFGVREHFGLDGKDVDIWMGTLSKTLASCGGYIAGEHALIEHLKYSAPGFLYSVGMAPPAAAAARAALDLMRREPQRVTRLQQRGRRFLEGARDAGVDVGYSTGLGVVPAVTGSSIKAARLANDLMQQGINVQPIVYPAVEEKAARLRFFMSSEHTEQDLDKTVSLLSEAWA